MTDISNTHEGGCSCGQVRYQLTSKPLVVHCCHCSWCQRQTGSAFVINAIFESKNVTITQGEVVKKVVPSPSSRGQIIVRCPECLVALWSHYYMGGIIEGVSFIRVGTLDNPNLYPPDVHIYTTTKQDWLVLPEDAVVVEEFYAYEDVWSKESIEIKTKLLSQFKSQN